MSEADAQPMEQPHGDRPNVVFILADDAGWGDVSSYGAERFETPNIDRLAAEGMRFTDAHSPSAVCTPSRYSLLTGRYGFRSWAGGNVLQGNDPLLIEPDRLTVAEVFKEAGYDTAIVGKWHLGFGREGDEHFDSTTGIDYNGPITPGPLEVGFDTFFGVPMVGQLPHIYIRDHHVERIDELDGPIEFVPDKDSPQFNVPWYERHKATDVRGPKFAWTNTEPIKYEHEDMAVRLTDEAVSYIDAREPDKPFFLYFAHRNPHVPWTPNGRFKGATTFETDAGRRYGEFMVELDWSVGQVLDALERKGIVDDTLIIFSSDNGGALYYTHVNYAEREGHFTNGPYRGQKTEAWEGGHRVPFIVRWPGVVQPGTQSDALIANTDFMATIADILDVALPEGQAPDSHSILPLLTGASDGPVRETLVVDTPNGLLAIRKGPWKYIPAQGGGGFRWRPYTLDYSQPPAQLYNLDDDPREAENVIARHPDIARELHELLAREAADRDDIDEFKPAER